MSRTSFPFALASALCLAAWASFVPAQAPRPEESETKKPYELQVVLHLADNPGLTDVFYDRIERELSDSLQADFGDLVHVEVVRKHPLLKDVLDKGLANVLKTWTDRNGIKTHFVLIDFNGVDYDIQTGQCDGVTGQPNPVLVVETERNPVVRHEQKRDREFVAKAAALMVERDFGLIASFPSWPPGKTRPQTVQLEFKGGNLAPLDRWVKKGDVFAVVQVPNGNGASKTIPDALVLMQDAPKDGVGTGQLFWRYELLPTGGTVSYRCVKLGTVAGPLRVRVVKQENNKPFAPVDTQLQIRRTGFTGEKQTAVNDNTSGAGLFDSTKLKGQGVFDQVAFVSIVNAKGDSSADVVVPLLTEQPYLIKLTNKPDAVQAVDFDKLDLTQSVRDLFTAMESVITDMQQLAAKEGTRAEIIKKGQAALNQAQSDYPDLVARRGKLPAAAANTVDARDQKQMDLWLKRIGERTAELTKFLATQEKIAKEENDPARLDWKAKVEQGKLMEKELELGKAIALYEALPKNFETPELKARIAQLHKLWDTDDEEFRKARSFIYDTFPKLKDSTAIQAKLPEASKAFEECKRVNDTIAPQKLLTGIGLLLPRLATEGEGLNPRLRADDDIPAKRLQEVGAGIDKLLTDIKEYLDQQKPK